MFWDFINLEDNIKSLLYFVSKLFNSIFLQVFDSKIFMKNNINLATYIMSISRKFLTGIFVANSTLITSKKFKEEWRKYIFRDIIIIVSSVQYNFHLFCIAKKKWNSSYVIFYSNKILRCLILTRYPLQKCSWRDFLASYSKLRNIINISTRL